MAIDAIPDADDGMESAVNESVERAVEANGLALSTDSGLTCRPQSEQHPFSCPFHVPGFRHPRDDRETQTPSMITGGLRNT